MDTLPIRLTAMSLTFFHLTDINTMIVDADGSIQLLHEHDRMPEFMGGTLQNDLRALWAEAWERTPACCLRTNDWGLSYIAKSLRLEADKRDKAIVVGPFMMQVPDVNRLDARYRIGQVKRIELETYYRGLKLISMPKVQSLANMLDQSETIGQARLHVPEPEASLLARALPPQEAAAVHKQPDEEFIDLIDLRYKVEQEIRQAVRHGDQPSLRQIREKTANLYDFSDRFPNQPVRALKNSLIVLNTLLRVAAYDGRVQPIHLHRISEKYSKLIERTETIDALSKLMDVMFDDYCALVRQRSVSGYSPAVLRAVQYIAVYYQKPLVLAELAEVCRVHPAHLSRQFKKETGMTLTDYQQKQRVEEAKLLLAAGDTPVKWVAASVGFDDAGYFARIFRKLTGLTPSDYQSGKNWPAPV